MTTILFIGCGKMGSALLSGFIKSGIDESNIVVVEPHIQSGSDMGKVTFVTNQNAIPSAFTPDIVLFCVKPQILHEILPLYTSYKNSLFISIAAGKNLAFYEQYLGQKAVIRIMPNLPAIVGMGVSVGIANPDVNKKQKEICAKLFTSVGKFFWLNDEKHMDAVTAISGSGPAYLFHFIEAMENAAKDLGLPDDIAGDLARQTVYGSAELARMSDKNATELRKAVTSPNGTTQAALDILMRNNALQELISKTADAAEKRSIELG